MHWHRFVLAASVLFALVSRAGLECAWGEDSPSSKPRWNLVAIVTDDQGRWAMGAYGNADIHTPNMDRIAREGALFTNAIAACPVCSPSRATYLTGRYPTELGITDWIHPQEAAEGVGLRGLTWPAVLQRHGYRTALIGKWHLGAQPAYHPTRMGFDYFLGFLHGGNRPMNAVLEVDGRQQRTKGPLPDVLTDAAIGFIRRHHQEPFAVCLHFRAPHLPYGPVPEEDKAHYRDTDPQVPTVPGYPPQRLKQRTLAYYASISSVDRNVGRLLKALEELELDQRTIVVFTSDHGYNEGRHNVNTKGNGHWIAGAVSGPKRPNMWETSITVPLAVRWPGVVRPGTVIDYPVSNLDMFRTVLGMLELPLPKDCQARGIDFSPLLRGESLPERPALFGQYDLHNNGLAYLRMVRTRRWKLVKHFKCRGLDELYDLKNDPHERRNLLRRGRKSPEVRQAQQKLEAMLHQWMQQIDDPLLKSTY